ncbi:hypothetical protein ACGFRB_23450 [Streptomyces sp. NPDC048718]|uniref:hypothetical protein n=1 Tax=Streptomyces sp. NPDC048718 TaxID=3365587 RepID=UPI00371B26F1
MAVSQVYYEYEGSRRVARPIPTAASGTDHPVPCVQPPDSGVSVRAAVEALESAPDAGRFTEVFSHTFDEDHGAFPQMQEFVEAAVRWCREHGASDSADHLVTLQVRLEELVEDAVTLPKRLAVELATLSLEQRSPERAPVSQPLAPRHPANITPTPSAPFHSASVPTTKPRTAR